MGDFDIIIRQALIVDGSGEEPFVGDLGIRKDKIAAIGNLKKAKAPLIFDSQDKILCPGFIDVHTHDDISVIQKPEMIPKISQGVTTVVVGNCGFSASPIYLTNPLPGYLENLLGKASYFHYPQFSDYIKDIERVSPAVNVAALVGHSSLRSNHMTELDRSATDDEIELMKSQLREALNNGALGLSTGLAYPSAFSASTNEVKTLAEELTEFDGIYVTHMRTESDNILDAIEEAVGIGKHAKVPTIISHLKCAGKKNWGRAEQVLELLQELRMKQPLGWDCYPYTASSTILDMKQVTEDYDITVTWSESHKNIKGNLLSDIAEEWKMNILDTAKKLQPAGAIYHNMSEDDMQMFLSHPAAMIGSDGLPNDPHPHPRLWGTFPRTLSYCCRNLNLFNLSTAIHKMTGLPARRFGWNDRGRLKEGFAADLVLFDFAAIQDIADYKEPQRKAIGIEAVIVNGELTYQNYEICGKRNGRFLSRGKIPKSIPY